MHEILKVALLAVVQGLTEFLPVSSSGHLVILGDIIDLKGNSVLLFSVLHAGTLISILFVYFREIIYLLRSARKRLLLIFVSSIPAAIVGISLHISGLDKKLFESPMLAGFGLLMTAGILLIISRKQIQSKEISDMSFKDAFLIGMAQCVAILPGVSRSGATISTALRLKLKRSEASTYSFLMALPVIAGATFIELLPVLRNPDINNDSIGMLPMTLGFVISAIVGYISLNIVITSVRKGSLNKYGYYCFALGVLVLLYQFLLKS